MDIKDYKDNLRQFKQVYAGAKELSSSINLDGQKERLKELEAESMKDDFWQNKERFAEVNKEISLLKRKIEPWDFLLNDLSESIELIEMALEEEDMDVLAEVSPKILEIEKRFKGLETLELLSEEDDFNNAYISIHPGAGGTESQDWASMLLRMYSRWADQHGLSIQMIDYTPGDEAGIKSAMALVKGDYSFGYLKGENGVHRLVRISPFDANKRRHTSFASIEVIPEISDEINVEVNESDLKIDTYRASGAGGQHVNTTDSAVRITHIPTGIVVQCQNERSQHKNKASAMKVLKARIYEVEKQQQAEKLNDKMGEKKEISWGNQIRSYVFQPYTLVKDHRTNEETGSVDNVFDGDIDRFIFAYLKYLKQTEVTG